MKRDVFEHVAYEAHADLLRAVLQLLPKVGSADPAFGRALLEIDRESWTRANRVVEIPREHALNVRARAAEFDVQLAIPACASNARWRAIQRSVDRLETMRKLNGPVELICESLREMASAGLEPGDYHAPELGTWTRRSDFISAAIELVTDSRDEVGLGADVNALPEAAEFFDRYPDAYSFWDVHAQVPEGEDPDQPDPERYPAAIWTAPAITPLELFSGDDPCGTDGPASFVTASSARSEHLHPKLAAAVAHAASRGMAVVGYVAVRP